MGKLLEPFGQSVTVDGLFGHLGCVHLCNKSCFDVYEAGNGHGFRVHKVEPMLGVWP